jgi:hypothetical protein
MDVKCKHFKQLPGMGGCLKQFNAWQAEQEVKIQIINFESYRVGDGYPALKVYYQLVIDN